MRFSFSRFFSTLAVIGPVLLMQAGCLPIIKTLREASPDEIKTNSYTILIEGFKETVTVNAPLEEVLEFITGKEKSGFRGVVAAEYVPPLGQEEVGEIGSSIIFDYKYYFITIVGQMILVKKDENSAWNMRDFPTDFNTWQWELEPAEDGTRVHYRSAAYIADNWVTRLVEKFQPREYFYESTDMLLADIQAHFDPSEDPEELLSMGFRGEAYNTYLQVNEALIWLDVKVEQVQEYLNTHQTDYLRIGKLEEDCISQPMPREQVLYCQSLVELDYMSFEMDNFSIERALGNIHRRRIYHVGLDMVGYLEFLFMPIRGGTSLVISWVWETPDANSPDIMHQTMFMTTLPGRLEQTAREIKLGVEKYKSGN